MRTLQLFTLALLATAARADDITFRVVDDLDVTLTGPSRLQGCDSIVLVGWYCTIPTPLGETLSRDYDDPVYIVKDPTDLIGYPGTASVTARFKIEGFVGGDSYTLFFSYFGGSATCADMGPDPCFGVRKLDEGVPVIALFASFDTTADVIRFEPLPAPEPSVFLLLGTVTLALLTSRRLRRGAF